MKLRKGQLGIIASMMLFFVGCSESENHKATSKSENFQNKNTSAIVLAKAKSTGIYATPFIVNVPIKFPCKNFKWVAGYS